MCTNRIRTSTGAFRPSLKIVAISMAVESDFVKDGHSTPAGGKVCLILHRPGFSQ